MSEHNKDEDKGKKTTIIVNGREKIVEGREITFDQVVALGLDPVPTGEFVVITVTYSGGNGPNHEGSLVKGQSVKIKKGMRFVVKATDRS
jgi:multiubiquitin